MQSHLRAPPRGDDFNLYDNDHLRIIFISLYNLSI